MSNVAKINVDKTSTVKKSTSSWLTPKNIGIILVIGFILLTIIYWSLPAKLTPRLSSYISLIAFLSVILGIFSFFLSQRAQENQQKQGVLASSLSFIQSIIALEQYFAANPDMNNLYKGINPGNVALQSLPDVSPVTDAMKYKEIHVIAWMIQIVENVNDTILARGITWDDPEMIPFVDTFHGWFHYPPVREQWNNVLKNRSTPQLQQVVRHKFL
jgi:UDP-N-acetylmuramyl pentapeptide phosphotransferase/UDP-N-acetylglucosamine-1-phosphate transferase